MIYSLLKRLKDSLLGRFLNWVTQPEFSTFHKHQRAVRWFIQFQGSTFLIRTPWFLYIVAVDDYDPVCNVVWTGSKLFWSYNPNVPAGETRWRNHREKILSRKDAKDACECL